MPRERLEAGVLGAAGLVGQHLVARLAGHPWFSLAWLGGSERSAGRRFGDLPWRPPGAVPAPARDLLVEAPAAGRAPHLLFSALDAAVAGAVEQEYAAAGHIVVSNARNHRLDPHVPLLVPEINAEHLGLVPAQRRDRGWPGAIVTNPNCSTVFLALVLAALRPFEPQRVVVTTLQAASGAGHPGVASFDLLGNVIPFIDGEEEKLEVETRRILGRLEAGRVEPAPLLVSATTTRVPVLHGHTESIAVELRAPAALDEIRSALAGFSGRPQHEALPTAPARPIVVLDDPNRPQPRLDADLEDGMAVAVGRLRACPVFDCRLVALGHNLVRGAAGAAILNAELMVADGFFD